MCQRSWSRALAAEQRLRDLEAEFRDAVEQAAADAAFDRGHPAAARGVAGKPATACTATRIGSAGSPSTMTPARSFVRQT
jgi:hypothetical protein